MNQEQAETVAIQALGWLAGEEDLLGVFLGATGADINELKQMAGNPEFLGSVLDFILMDDDWVKAFCESKSFEFNEPYLARQFLPGGDLPNWT